MTDQTKVVVDQDKKTEALCPYPGCGRPLGDGHHHNNTEPEKAGLDTNGHHHNNSEPAKAGQA